MIYRTLTIQRRHQGYDDVHLLLKDGSTYCGAKRAGDPAIIGPQRDSATHPDARMTCLTCTDYYVGRLELEEEKGSKETVL